MKKQRQEHHNDNLRRLVAITLGLPWVEIVIEAWKLGSKVLRGLASEGMYEVLEYESTLEIHDKSGKKATYKKRQKVRYLQDNIIAYEDQAWGDGEILLDYKCSPGTAVARYRLDYKTYILISLREIKNRGDIDEFHIEWGIREGFMRKTEQWSTNVRKRIRRLRVSVIFPTSRPPIEAAIIESTRRRTATLENENIQHLPDGRWQVTWEKEKPRLYETYILKWSW